MPRGLIFDIRRFSIHDGPGIRTSVFFKGCPLSCRWCHNPESQAPSAEMMVRASRCIHCGVCLAACEHDAVFQESHEFTTDGGRCTLCGACVAACYAETRQIVGQEMTVAQVMAEIERDVPFYDESAGGITLSGGEPLMLSAFLLALLRACKQASIHTALDTCGYALWETVDVVREHIDLFLYDLKLMDDARHHLFTGVSNQVILENLRALSQAGHSVLLRVPLLPGINDDKENLRQIAKFAAELPHLAGIDLLPYHAAATEKYERLGRAYELRATRPPSEAKLAQTARMLEQFGFSVKIGG